VNRYNLAAKRPRQRLTFQLTRAKIMSLPKIRVYLTAIIVVCLSPMALSHDNHIAVSPSPISASNINNPLFTLDVFKSPTCGCCTEWITKLEDNKIAVKSFHPADLSGVKSTLNIRPEYQSCHTAVSKEGFFFEGHVPVYLMKQFLANPPKNAAGLSVPGMPIGSPGMEMDNRFQPYKVVLIKENGDAEIYAEIKTLEQSLQ
jgi:hypothetical protein